MLLITNYMKNPYFTYVSDGALPINILFRKAKVR